MHPAERALAAADAEDAAPEASVLPLQQMSTALFWIVVVIAALIAPVILFEVGWKAALGWLLTSLPVLVFVRRTRRLDPGVADAMLAASGEHADQTKTLDHG